LTSYDPNLSRADAGVAAPLGAPEPLQEPRCSIDALVGVSAAGSRIPPPAELAGTLTVNCSGSRLVHDVAPEPAAVSTAEGLPPPPSARPPSPRPASPSGQMVTPMEDCGLDSPSNAAAGSGAAAATAAFGPGPSLALATDFAAGPTPAVFSASPTRGPAQDDAAAGPPSTSGAGDFSIRTSHHRRGGWGAAAGRGGEGARRGRGRGRGPPRHLSDSPEDAHGPRHPGVTPPRSPLSTPCPSDDEEGGPFFGGIPGGALALEGSGGQPGEMRLSLGSAGGIPGVPPGHRRVSSGVMQTPELERKPCGLDRDGLPTGWTGGRGGGRHGRSPGTGAGDSGGTDGPGDPGGGGRAGPGADSSFLGGATRLFRPKIARGPKVLVLVRHGESEYNAAAHRLEEPAIWDPDLTERGRQQCADLRERLRRDPDVVAEGTLWVVSPLARAVQTFLLGCPFVRARPHDLRRQLRTWPAGTNTAASFLAKARGAELERRRWAAEAGVGCGALAGKATVAAGEATPGTCHGVGDERRQPNVASFLARAGAGPGGGTEEGGGAAVAAVAAEPGVSAGAGLETPACAGRPRDGATTTGVTPFLALMGLGDGAPAACEIGACPRTSDPPPSDAKSLRPAPGAATGLGASDAAFSPLRAPPPPAGDGGTPPPPAGHHAPPRMTPAASPCRPSACPVRVTVQPLVTECLLTAGDVGRPVSELAAIFGSVLPPSSFEDVPDTWWYNPTRDGGTAPNCTQRRTLGSGEPSHVIKQRIARFHRWALDRPERVLVVVAHSCFLKRFMKSLPACGDAADRSLRNGEYVKLIL